MDLRYEIEQLLELSTRGEKHWEWEGTYEAAASSFLRDHGQALVELVDRPDGVVISMELAQFLIGAAPLDEKWFGEPNRKGRSFWWRGDIQQAIDIAQTKASAGGGA